MDLAPVGLTDPENCFKEWKLGTVCGKGLERFSWEVKTIRGKENTENINLISDKRRRLREDTQKKFF